MEWKPVHIHKSELEKYTREALEMAKRRIPEPEIVLLAEPMPAPEPIPEPIPEPVPEPEPVAVQIEAELEIAVEIAAEPEPVPEPEAVIFPEEAILEELVASEIASETDVDAFEDETDNPFANFAGCECKEEHHPRCNTARQQRPPNFDKFINEHNTRSKENCSCNDEVSSGRGFSMGGGSSPGGFSWKDFKKN